MTTPPAPGTSPTRIRRAGTAAGRGRLTNIALLFVLAVALVTGTVAFALGAPSGRVVVVVHGIAGLALLVLSPWKTAIARRGLRRRNRGSAASLILAVLVVITVVSGVAHAAGVRSLPIVLTAMHVHVVAALASIPLAVWHFLIRGVRPRRTDASRRALLGAGLLGGAATVLWAGWELVLRLADSPGSARRFTGSHEQGSDDPERMPVIMWLTDDVQRLDAEAWRLRVQSLDGGVRWLTVADLHGREEVVRATIDCTSGWYAAQDWHGIRLDHLLDPAAEARSVVVRSATGYERRFPVEDLGRLWLATGYAGRPLAPAHGAPARLVAPGRRGFWWVKWVTGVRLDGAPWWAQPPFPLQ